MVWVHVRLTVGVVADTVRGQVEQRVIRIEHSSGKLDIEISEETTSIDTCLAFISHLDLVLELLWLLVRQLLVGTLEDVATLDMHGESATTPSRIPLLLDLLVEVFSLVLKVEQIRHILHDVCQLKTEIGSTTTLKQFVDHLLVVEAEDAEVLETVRDVLIDVLKEAQYFAFGISLLEWAHPNLRAGHFRSLLSRVSFLDHSVQVRQMRLENAPNVAHQLFRLVLVVRAVQDRENLVDEGDVFNHAPAPVELRNLLLDGHQDKILFRLLLVLSIFLLLFFRLLDLIDLSLELVVNREGVLEGLEGVFVLHNHLFQLYYVISA